MNEKLLKELCERICEENLTYEEVTILCEMNNIEVKVLLDYFRKYVEDRSNIEKRVYSSIKNNEEKELRKLPFLNPILMEFGIYTYYLWENDIEHDKMAKFVYGYSCTIGRETGCNNLSKKYNIPVEILLDLHDYYKEQLKKEEISIKQNVIASKTDIFFDRIFECNMELGAMDYASLIKIIKDRKFDKKQLNYSLLGYLTKNKLSTDYYYDKIKKIISVCFKYVKEEEQINKNNKVSVEKIEEAKLLLNSFIESNLDLEEFCDINSISLKKMEKSALLIQDIDTNLISVYRNVCEIRKMIKENMIKTELYKLNNYIVNGIEINGIKRSFSVVDYFININLDYKKLITYMKLIDDEEVLANIRRFRNETVQYTFNINAIANRMINTEFTIKTDNGGLRKLALEEKINIIEYLKSNGVPINEYTVYHAYELFVNDSLLENIEEEVEITKSC